MTRIGDRLVLEDGKDFQQVLSARGQPVECYVSSERRQFLDDSISADAKTGVVINDYAARRDWRVD